MKIGQNFWKRYGEDVLLQFAFLIWAIWAAYFYQERLYSDAGFYMAKVVHYESFWIELGRYILVFSQWLPLLCVKLGCSMKVVLLAYSLGHVLFYYSIYLFCRYRWGQGHVGWWLVGVQCIGILHGFCTPIFELYYNTGFLVLWVLLLRRGAHTWKALLAVAVLSFFVTINYVLAIIFFGAVVVLYTTQQQLKHWPLYTATAFGILLGFLLKQTLLAHPYETAKIDWFWHNFHHETFSWDRYIRPLFHFYATYYVELFLLIGGALGYYVKQKQYSTALAFIALLVATQYVIALTYPIIKHSRYQEQCFFPLIMLGCFPLLMDILPQLKNKARYGVQLALLALIAYRFIAIADGIEPFRLRVEYLHRMIEHGREQGVYKIIMEEESLNSNVNGPSFTFGLESLLLSALTPEQRAVQLIRDSEWVDGNNAQTLQDSTLYLATYRSYYEKPDSIYRHATANPRYFNFPPSPYVLARGRYSSFQQVEQLKDNMTLEPNLKEQYPVGTPINVGITIKNNSDQAWSSAGLLLSYHWWRADTVVHWEGERSVVEMDFLPQSSHEQYLVVHPPEEAGTYQLQIDLIGPDEIGWCHYQQWYPLRIERTIFKKK